MFLRFCSYWQRRSEERGGEVRGLKRAVKLQFLLVSGSVTVECGAGLIVAPQALGLQRLLAHRMRADKPSPHRHAVPGMIVFSGLFGLQ